MLNGPMRSVKQIAVPKGLICLVHWEAALFHTVELRHPPHEIVRYLAKETFLRVSNGAEKIKCAAFGWTISRSHGHRLVQCAGPVYGADPSSFRAEG